MDTTTKKPKETAAQREKRWEAMAYDILTREYLTGLDDVSQVEDGAEVTRRYYRRFELVQERVIDNESRDNGDSLACRKGCGYCCNNRVAAPAHELLTLADRIERMPDAQRAAVMERVARNAERIDSMDARTAFRTPMPCALLGEDNACTVYEDRPSSCRRYHSLALKDCETSFFRPTDLTSKIRLSTPLLVANAAQYLGFRKVLTERGLDGNNYEMHTALREALADPNACGQRYGRGEAAFLHATQYGDKVPA